MEFRQFQQSRWHTLLQLITPFFLAAINLIITAVVSYYVYTNGLEKQNSLFDSASKQVELKLQTALTTSSTLLYAVRGLIDSSGRFSYPQFSSFAMDLRLTEKYPGILGVAYVQKVPENQLASFLTNMRATDPHFELFPQTKRDVYYPVVYMEPVNDRNKRAIGFDSVSDAKRAQAMEKAIDTATVVISDNTNLLQDSEFNQQKGFLMYLPIYQNGIVPNSVTQRRNLTSGFVYLVFDMLKFANTVIADETPQVSFTIYDGGQVDANKQIYTWSPDPNHKPKLKKLDQLNFNDHVWTIEYGSTAGIESSSGLAFIPYIILFGIGMTAFIYTTSRNQIMARSVVERAHNDLLSSQKELRQSEERLRLLVDNTQDYAIIMLDKDGNIVSWNKGAERMYGYEEREVYGQSYALFFNFRFRSVDSAKRKLARAERMGGYQFEMLFRKRDKTKFWAGGTIAPLFGDENVLRGFALICRDITNRRRTEEILRKEEALTQSVLNSLPSPITVLDNNGTILAVNEPFKAFLKKLSDDVRSKFVVGGNYLTVMRNEISANTDDFNRDALKKIEDVMSGKNKSIAMEYVITNNETNSQEWYLMLVSTFKHNPGGVVISHTEITERIRLENQKDEFLSIASHELKTPITSAKAYAQILFRLVGDQHGEQISTIIQKMERQLDRMSMLIGDLFDVSRIQAGKLQMNNSFFNYDELVKETCATLQLVHNKHTIQLHGVSNVTVFADRDRIEQVLINLINNAVKYSPKNTEITVRLEINTNKIITSIEDQGSGIPKDLLPHVFERFFRGVDNTKKTLAGLGLGLYISAAIINRSGGRIYVKSKVGKGSKFSFELPIAAT